jgi:AsmA protein
VNPTKTLSNQAATAATSSLRTFGFVVASLVSALTVSFILLALFGWNWLRGPIESFALKKTGRTLSIAGDLSVTLGWPVVRLHAASVSFTNPSWTHERQMIVAQGVDVAVNFVQILSRRIVIPELRLDHAVVSLEQSLDGRKSWLLDLEQQDEEARIQIGRVALDYGTLVYEDIDQKTKLRVQLSTVPNPGVHSKLADLRFSVLGKYKDLPVKAEGFGGPVLALRDTKIPYLLRMAAMVGRTGVELDGTITDLLTLTAVDMHMALRGESLEHLYTLLGIAFPATRPYAIQGHLVHSGTSWQYEKFSGRFGSSDIAGSTTVTTGSKRPELKADLKSSQLDLDDLSPMIGFSTAKMTRRTTRVVSRARVLPALPFKADRWSSVNAEVQLRAITLRRAKAVPLDNLLVHLSLQDSVLTLDPLDFGVTGGQTTSRIRLDGRSSPISAQASVRVRKVSLSKLSPTIARSSTKIGHLNGNFDLNGRGDSIGNMLASANGKVVAVLEGGQISKLLMEKVGLHLWEILTLSLTGDRMVRLRCAVAAFDVTHGMMQPTALVLDTEVTTVYGTGSIDLAQEKLDLVLEPRTKDTSLLALRSPIYVRGSFAQPKVEFDTVKVVVRAAGALAMGSVSPLLALVPLVDAGPGKDSDCSRILREAGVRPLLALDK